MKGPKFGPFYLKKYKYRKVFLMILVFFETHQGKKVQNK